MSFHKQYSITQDYWTLSIGFGIGSAAVFFVLVTRYHLLRFLNGIYRAFPQHPVQASLYAAGLGLVLLTILVLAYIPLRGLLFPKRIKGVLEGCSLEKQKQQDNSVAIRIAGESHKARFNQQAFDALQSALGKQVRVTLGALGTILLVETIATPP